jgi:hypothetical protein
VDNHHIAGALMAVAVALIVPTALLVRANLEGVILAAFALLALGLCGYALITTLRDEPRDLQ